jgi:hypothetical protein
VCSRAGELLEERLALATEGRHMLQRGTISPVQ